MKLISWNIQWCRGCDGRVDPARIAKVAREMADFDVLCLQEVASNYPDLEGSSGENQFAALARLFPRCTVVKGVATDGPAPQGERREFGNAIVTRLPILQVFRRLLPWPADPSVPSMQRAAQVETLRELQTEAAGHAAAPVPAKEGPFRTMPRPASAILTADFNFPPGDALHARLQSPLAPGVPAYRDAWQLSHPGKAHAPTVGVHDKPQWPGPPFACDFIFVTEDLAHRVEDVVVNGETDASDHQPVLLELRD